VVKLIFKTVFGLEKDFGTKLVPPDRMDFSIYECTNET
jgi:hypothetical protein